MQNTNQIPEPIRFVPAKYEHKKSCYVETFQALQSFRKHEVFCDIQLGTDDGGVIFGHKVVLASASPYFHDIFTNTTRNHQDFVLIENLDSTALHLLIDYIYSGKIFVTEKNVEVLLPAANLLQLQDVKEVCCDFLQTQLCLANCIEIFALADLHSSTKLLSSSELYIQQHFSDVVKGDGFLSLSSEQMVKLIASEELKVSSEEKVFESVIRWIKHDLGSRNYIVSKLMEHVRLPLISKDYILKHVVTEPLLNNCPKCKDYVIEALHFYLLTSDELITIPHNIRTKPRQSSGSHKVILVIGKGKGGIYFDGTEWYDPKINKWQSGPRMITPRFASGLAVVKDNFVFSLGGVISGSSSRSVDVLDLSSKSPSWKRTVDMLVKRRNLGVGVINSFLYAVGGDNGIKCLNSSEVFDCRTREWRMISSMSISRADHGIGVLNNLLYAVGGFDEQVPVKSVECYHPTFDEWTPIKEMCFPRCNLSVGVLDGVLYAVGGNYGSYVYKSVEVYRPTTGFWSTIPDMHIGRRNAGVAVLDGLLYVIRGNNGISVLDSVESYNPNTKSWTMITGPMYNVLSKNIAFTAEAVVVERPRHLKKCYHSCFSFLIQYINSFSFCIIVSLLLFYLFYSF